MNYSEFLKQKQKLFKGQGIEAGSLNSNLFAFQRSIVEWALRKGKSAIFADCGLGKTLMQLSWAEQIPGRVILVAPLAVSEQTKREADKFGIIVGDLGSGCQIEITNYEKLHRLNVYNYDGVVLDESSILKNYSGKIRNEIIDSFARTPYKLACSATPAPNDFMELGNHAEFLEVCTRTEMLAEYFVHDGAETQKWRIKGHAQGAFWRWLSSWAITIQNPNDIGFADQDFYLPELKIERITVSARYEEDGYLFPMMAGDLKERRTARKKTTEDRAQAAASLIEQSPNEPWIVWCNLNNEAESICGLIPEAVEVRGSDKPEDKADRMLGFADGRYRVLVTKPSIAGFGMNWQHCRNIIFLGISDSYEEFYQAVRRCWRFGQTQTVTAHVIVSDVEGNVVENIRRKEKQAQTMNSDLVKKYVKEELGL